MSDALDSISDLLDQTNTSKQNSNSIEQPKVAIEKLRPDPEQPRKEIDQELLKALAEDIKKNGVKQPVNIIDDDEKGEGFFIIKMGETRYQASLIAGLLEMPVHYEPNPEKITDFDQVRENQYRSALTPFELAIFINKKTNDGLSFSKIGKEINMTKSTVAKIAKLVDLPQIGIDLHKKELIEGYTSLYTLTSIYEILDDEFKDYCEFIKSKNGITLKELEQYLKRLKNGDKEFQEPDPVPEHKDNSDNESNDNEQEDDQSNIVKKIVEKDLGRDPYIDSLEIHFSENLGQKVVIKQKENEKGSITIHYSSLDEFDGIQDRLNIPKLD